MRNLARHRSCPSPVAVVLATVRASRSDLLIAAVLALAALPGVAVLLAAWLPGTPLLGLALLVPGAVIVGGARLMRVTGGPDIHDRQLDRIVAALTAAGAVALVVAGLPAGGLTLRSVVVLTTPLLAVGLIALLHGTRRLWQQRAAPALLFAAWPVPWEAVLGPLEKQIGASALTGAVSVVVGVVVVVLVVRPRRVRTAAVPAPSPVPADPALPTAAAALVPLTSRAGSAAAA